jgi:hypothetical protein
MSSAEYPEAFLRLLQSVKGKRARVVVDHILEHGFITTEELENTYGYSHPPRAIQDVRDQGVPIETFSVKNAAGRTIAAYRFGDVSQILPGRIGGRKLFPKSLKRELLQQSGSRCAVCLTVFEERYLQIDHRVPYQVIGDLRAERQASDYMLLCGSCNRAKSWSCEHCANGLQIKDPILCQSCYWANPEDYQHIALRPVRRLDLTWTEAEIEIYDKLMQQAQASGENLPDFIKKILKNILDQHQ